ncbi:MAG TPA: DNA-formamidopyrimidine glycosylase family protein [Vicinamibacterales bacterium]|nr:DNA-formamidopyrimidine glycosylase family protein [Vicinamibacterales bacterium]
MPEGDTVFRAAQTLHRYMAGHVVTRFESVYPALTRIAEDRPVVGRTIQSVSARGKHLLMTFSGDLVLRTHLRMNGSWHIYPSGGRWHRPARDMRVLVCTVDACGVGFNIPVAELLSGLELDRHRQLQALGPDLLAEPFDRAEAVRRMRGRAGDAIADVLLDQRVIAGIGNVFKSEILFLAGIHPFTPAGLLTGDDLERIVGVAREQLAANVMTRSQTLSTAIGRRTTRSLDPNEKLWIYSRGGRPCRRCGAAIRSEKSGLDARVTYWCPNCQPMRDPEEPSGV